MHLDLPFSTVRDHEPPHDRGTLYGKGIYFAECVTKAVSDTLKPCFRGEGCSGFRVQPLEKKRARQMSTARRMQMAIAGCSCAEWLWARS